MSRSRKERTRAERRSRTQKLLVLILAAALVIPLGATGIASLWAGRDAQQETESAAPTTAPRAEVDPASQPAPAPTAPPELPAGTDEQTAAGAEASLVALLDIYGYMMATGDIGYWTEHTSPDCAICSTFIDQTELLHTLGGYQAEAGIGTGETASETTDDPATSAHVEVRIVQEPGYLVDDPTLEAQPVYAATGIISAEMSWDGTKWVVDDMFMQQDAAAGEGAPATGAPDPAAG